MILEYFVILTLQSTFQSERCRKLLQEAEFALKNHVQMKSTYTADPMDYS